ncbi:putative bifunctional diguanylate cyclase/phosphodiesterase [Hirschia litorea]|uniref:Bifunctional diguanylate cyclase/phosphodiesterase n=1 Tax=Hirschia litorea TaxID=1199156 RepID=A0ABW2IIB8_9PROT
MKRFSFRSFFLGQIEIPKEKEAWLRAEQHSAFLDMAPIAGFGLTATGLFLSILHRNDGLGPIMFTWSYSGAVLAYVMIRAWLKSRDRDTKNPSSVVPAQKIAVWSGGVGTVWGLLVALMMMTGYVNLALVGAVAVGMLGMGAFVLSVIPIAALAFMSAILVGFTVGASLTGEVNFLISLPIFFIFVVVMQRYAAWTFTNFITQRLDRDAVAESSEVISLLLHDFETQSSDWLWETDNELRLNRVSKRFAEAVCRPAEVLNSEPFLQFFEEEAAERLEELLSNHRSFRDQVVPVRVDGEQCWWSISASPRIDVDGKFLGYRGVCSDVTQERAAETKIAYMAHFDALTGVHNRAHFNSVLETAVERMAETNASFALHCIDLDNFKTVNDTMGHPAGDALLKIVASRLSMSVSDGDIVGRLGGDEFVVLQMDCPDLESAQLVSDMITDALLEPITIENSTLPVSGSVGSAFAPLHGGSSKQIMQHADLALYAAKLDGRGCNRMFEPYMDEEARRRTQLEVDLRRAFQENELEMYYQPLMEVKTGKIKGYESLLRWRRGENDVLLPAEFIEIAEDTGLIVPLGEWIIRTAIAEAATWPDHITVAINLSPTQMKNPSLISTVINALATNALDPARVEFEITESVLLEESEINIKTLHVLRDLGVKIALDDFGTGFSSLNYLRAFPFDKIKIDKCFVTELETRADCRAIIRAVMCLANDLGMRTTAEGIENQNQINILKAQGCDEMQGFLFSRPISGKLLPRKDETAQNRSTVPDELHEKGRIHLLEDRAA